MAIGGQVALGDVSVEDIVREAVRWHHRADSARRVVGETLERLTAAIEEGVVPAKSEVGSMVAGRAGALLEGHAAGSRDPGRTTEP
jgi:hypothetical protein